MYYRSYVSVTFGMACAQNRDKALKNSLLLLRLLKQSNFFKHAFIVPIIQAERKIRALGSWVSSHPGSPGAQGPGGYPYSMGAGTQASQGCAWKCPQQDPSNIPGTLGRGTQGPYLGME